MTTTSSPWVRSSHSGNGSCVEWAPHTATTTGTVPVRDSKTPAAAVLTVPADGWADFVAAVRTGRLPRA